MATLDLVLPASATHYLIGNSHNFDGFSPEDSELWRDGPMYRHKRVVWWLMFIPVCERIHTRITLLLMPPDRRYAGGTERRYPACGSLGLGRYD